MNRLTEEAKKVCEVIQKFRCATIEQIEVILDNPIANASKVCHFLAIKQYLDIVEDQYLTVRNHREIVTEDIDCLWAVIDSMKYQDHFDYECFRTVQTFTGGTSKTRLSFIKDNKYIVNVAYLANYNTMDAAYLQNRFYETTGCKPGMEKEKGIVHYFVTRSKDVIYEIRNMNLQIPYAIVLLDYEGGKVPKITYCK